MEVLELELELAIVEHWFVRLVSSQARARDGIVRAEYEQQAS